MTAPPQVGRGKPKSRPAPPGGATTATIEGLIALMGSDVAKLTSQMPKVEKLQAQLVALKEHLAVQLSAVQRLLAEKQSLIVYCKVLEQRLHDGLK